MKKTVDEINRAISKGDVLILTAREVEDMLNEGRDKEVRDVDVVTSGTMGIMSGTYALLSFQIAQPGIHRKFIKARINGVPVTVGPCPNESLGIIDVIVSGTLESEDRPDYGGSYLFRDLVEGKEVAVEATSNEGREVETKLSINEMPTAKLLSSRNCFRNYRAYVNPSDREFTSIFHCRPFPPDYAGLTFSGCGHLNPIQNDPELRGIGIGTKILFNGAEGYIISNGTRSSEKYPNIMTIAEMKDMDPKLMGGYLTAAGVECLTSYAVPIPITDPSILTHVMTRDADIPLSIGDVRDRHKIGQADYGQVWSDCDEVVTMDRSRCVACEVCSAASTCPTSAIVMSEGRMSINRDRCINCGACIAVCPENCFNGRLGEVRAMIDGVKRAIPVLCRNSNREGAVRTMNDLKRKIREGTFTMTAKVSDIHP